MALSFPKKMKAAKTKVQSAAGGMYMEILKALALALVLTLGLALIMALIITLAAIPDSFIGAINQCIKAVSLCVGAIYGFKTKSGGWKKGLILGVLYAVFAYVVFSLMDGAFNFGWFILIDLVTAAAMGTICGIIAVNLKK